MVYHDAMQTHMHKHIPPGLALAQLGMKATQYQNISGAVSRAARSVRASRITSRQATHAACARLGTGSNGSDPIPQPVGVPVPCGVTVSVVELHDVDGNARVLSKSLAGSSPDGSAPCPSAMATRRRVVRYLYRFVCTCFTNPTHVA